MKSMVKFGLIALAAVIAFSSAACGKSSNSNSEGRSTAAGSSAAADSASSGRSDISPAGSSNGLTFGYTGELDGYVILDHDRAEINGNVTIPASYNGKPVFYIGYSAFAKNETITSVTIPDSVLIIGRDAFRDCTGITNIIIGNNVKEIEWYAFSGCTGLTSIIIPASVTEIGSRTFQDCPITSVTFLGSNLTATAAEVSIAFSFPDMMSQLTFAQAFGSKSPGTYIMDSETNYWSKQ